MDQVERANSLTSGQISELRASIAKAEKSKMSGKAVSDLRALVENLEKKVADSGRLQEILAVFE